jgi:YgiT-type zinc finger domain-containing protein
MQCQGEGVFDDYRHIVRDHVYDKCWRLDITWAEVERLIDAADVIETHDLGDEGVKEIRILLDWKRPLHLVYVVNHERQLVVQDHLRGRPAALATRLPRTEATMNCTECEGELLDEKRPKAVERDGRLAVVRDVPILVCAACGEVYMDTAVVRQLDILFRQMLDGPVDHVIGHYVASAA